MLPFEKLSEQDKEKIAACIKGNTSVVKNITPELNLEHILRHWNKEKQDLFQAFGEELILTKQIDLEPTDESIVTQTQSILNNDAFYLILVKLYKYVGALRHSWDTHSIEIEYLKDHNLAEYIPKYRLITALREDDLLNLDILLSKTLYVKNLYRNKFHCSNNYKFSLGKKDFHFFGEIKIMKFLKKLVDALELNAELFEAFRNKVSTLKNTVTKGTLCLSIHPLDYMTMSDNSSGWSSCMSWTHNGCYRQGTVEMMNSPYVVVAYLKGSKNTHYKADFSWNNKKWRELFIVHPQILTGVKAYPYENESVEKIVLDWLNELFNNKYDSTDDYDMYRELYLSNTRTTIEFCTDIMYNDFKEIETYSRGYIAKDIPESETIIVNYSGANECMTCGGPIVGFRSKDPNRALQCVECQGYWFCSGCGDQYELREDRIEHNGKTYCQHCFNRLFFTCPTCGESHLKSKALLLEIGYEEPFPLDWNNIQYCEHCFGALMNGYVDELASLVEYKGCNKYVIKWYNIEKMGKNFPLQIPDSVLRLIAKKPWRYNEKLAKFACLHCGVNYEMAMKEYEKQKFSTLNDNYIYTTLTKPNINGYVGTFLETSIGINLDSLLSDSLERFVELPLTDTLSF